jgi:Tfp pilus assembly protein PilO
MLRDLLRRPKFIAAVLVPLALVVAWWFAWMAPQNRHLASAHTQQTQAELQQSELNDRLVQLQHEATQVKAAAPFARRFSAAIPSTPDAPGLVNQVYALSQRAGVQLQGITDDSVNSEKTYSSIPVDIEATGKHNAIVAFVDGLYQLPRLLTVQSLDLSGSGPLNVSGNGQYQVSISATAYTTAAGSSTNGPSGST